MEFEVSNMYLETYHSLVLQRVVGEAEVRGVEEQASIKPRQNTHCIRSS